MLKVTKEIADAIRTAYPINVGLLRTAGLLDRDVRDMLQVMDRKMHPSDEPHALSPYAFCMPYGDEAELHEMLIRSLMFLLPIDACDVLDEINLDPQGIELLVFLLDRHRIPVGE